MFQRGIKLLNRAEGLAELIANFRNGFERTPLPVLVLEQPTDFVRADGRNFTSEDLQFAGVAYGLSQTEFFLPNPYCRDSV